mmetsp:Transcript_104151/g.261130  ORF Transcript_104151/g.261130 Transcript_104151/m.261130 type:complete len:216 (+) Transcript_104151:975-1622(+)
MKVPFRTSAHDMPPSRDKYVFVCFLSKVRYSPTFPLPMRMPTAFLYEYTGANSKSSVKPCRCRRHASWRSHDRALPAMFALGGMTFCHAPPMSKEMTVCAFVGFFVSSPSRRPIAAAAAAMGPRSAEAALAVRRFCLAASSTRSSTASPSGVSSISKASRCSSMSESDQASPRRRRHRSVMASDCVPPASPSSTSSGSSSDSFFSWPAALGEGVA